MTDSEGNLTMDGFNALNHDQKRYYHNYRQEMVDLNDDQNLMPAFVKEWALRDFKLKMSATK